MADLATVLGPNLSVSRGDLSRTSLTLQTIRLASQAERLAWLAQQLADMPGNGIVYTLTVRDAVSGRRLAEVARLQMSRPTPARRATAARNWSRRCSKIG